MTIYLQSDITLDITGRLGLLFLFLTWHDMSPFGIADPMMQKLLFIAMFAFVAFLIAIVWYPLYIRLLIALKAWKTIREDDTSGKKAKIFNKLHKHKAWTPTMGGGMFLGVMVVMIVLSLIVQYLGWTDNSLLSQRETYIPLFALFSLGGLWLVDDIFNIMGKKSIKWLTARAKLVRMFLFAWFITRWFYGRLGISHINLRPIAGVWDVDRLYVPITFFLTIAIVNAVNITDGLDGLAWGLLFFVFLALATVIFLNGRYIAATVVAILCAVLLAFLRYNIAPARVFMGDSGSLALGGILATLIYLINIKAGIIFPAVILLALFIIEVWSSALQMMSKKVRKKKLFAIAPFHHLLEHRGMAEHTIVMRLRLIQFLLTVTTLLLFFVQFHPLENLLP